MEENKARIVTNSSSFKVNDKISLYKFLGDISGEDLYTNVYTDKDGNIYGRFGAYSDVTYKADEIKNDEDFSKAFDKMLKIIQELLAEDSYCCIKTIGNNDLYVFGELIYITKKDIDVYTLNGIEEALTEEYFKKDKSDNKDKEK